jgi:uncharacterized GH25 family protein
MSTTTASFRRVCHALAAAVMFLGIAAASLHAHDFWMEPRAYRPEAGKLVALRLLVGQDLLGDPIPRDDAAIERFVMRQGGSEGAIPGRDGGDPAGILRVPGDGLMVVGYQSRPRRIELPRAKFETYLGEEGLDAVAAMFTGAKQQPQVARERFSRCAKALLSTGAASPSQKDQRLGLRLELVADGNPYTASSRDDMRFTLFYESVPRPGALVIAINRNDPSAKLSARSDARGRVSFRFPRRGVWLVKAVHMVALPRGHDADWESFWASLTFELP